MLYFAGIFLLSSGKWIKEEEGIMPRKPRMIVDGEPAVYHVISRTALDGFVLGGGEKDFLLQLIRKMSSVYFAEVLGFCIMGNHFHLVARMHTGEDVSDEEMRRRFETYYCGDQKRVLMPGQIPMFRQKWASLSEYVREIKQGFSRFYNKRHKRRGFFWSDRFKSVIVEDGETLINCLAYVDLNPVRAGLVKKPDDYRWNSLGYHQQTGNKSKFLSLDLGLTGTGRQSRKKRLTAYRQFVYEKGSLAGQKGQRISPEVVEKESRRKYQTGVVDLFLSRTRYFTDSGIIGSREFVRKYHARLQGEEEGGKEKIPKAVAGLTGVFSLKRLSEN
jgi:putative transposase